MLIQGYVLIKWIIQFRIVLSNWEDLILFCTLFSSVIVQFILFSWEMCQGPTARFCAGMGATSHTNDIAHSMGASISVKVPKTGLTLAGFWGLSWNLHNVWGWGAVGSPLVSILGSADQRSPLKEFCCLVWSGILTGASSTSQNTMLTVNPLSTRCLWNWVSYVFFSLQVEWGKKTVNGSLRLLYGYFLEYLNYFNKPPSYITWEWYDLNGAIFLTRFL